MTGQQANEILIAAPQEQVWAILADLETAERYDAFIERAFYVSDDRTGVGATRQCDLPDGSSIKERVTAWDEGDGYEIEASDDPSGAFPLVNQRVRFDLENRGQATLVRMTFSYEYAPDIAINRDEADGMAGELLGGVLGGLKQFVETGVPVAAPQPTT